MSQDDQYPERGYNTEDVAAMKDTGPPKRSFVRRHWGKLLIAAVLAVPAARPRLVDDDRPGLHVFVG